MMRPTEVTVIGLCGITCSGKSSISQLLSNYFKNPTYFSTDKVKLKNETYFKDVNNTSDRRDLEVFKNINVKTILMDDYFLPVDDSRHVLIPELGHINWELMTSLDMDKMIADVTSSINRLKSNAGGSILIIDGFLTLNSSALKSLCDLKFFIDLDHETCLFRRSRRVYDPPDVPGYFEKIVWPESQKNKEMVINSTPDLHILNGALPVETNFSTILSCLHHLWSQRS